VGNGLGDRYKPVKLIMLFVVTGLTLTSIFVTATSHTSDLIATNFYTINMIVIASVFVLWLFSAMSVLTGNRELAGATGVVFGVFNVFILMWLLNINDNLAALSDFNEAKQTRAGYVIGWFAGFAAILTVIPVYATPELDGVRAVLLGCDFYTLIFLPFFSFHSPRRHKFFRPPFFFLLLPMGLLHCMQPSLQLC
jgi:hypothetical protein